MRMHAGADYVTLSPIYQAASKPGYGPALGTRRDRAGCADRHCDRGARGHRRPQCCRGAGQLARPASPSWAASCDRKTRGAQLRRCSPRSARSTSAADLTYGLPTLEYAARAETDEPDRNADRQARRQCGRSAGRRLGRCDRLHFGFRRRRFSQRADPGAARSRPERPDAGGQLGDASLFADP